MIAPLLGCVALLGCGTSTRLDVEIDADDEVRASARFVELRVLGYGASAQSEFRETRATAEIGWPASAVILPRDGDASRELHITALALDGRGASIASESIATSFARGTARRVVLRLAAECAGNGCTPPEHDGGTVRDAGVVLDAGFVRDGGAARDGGANRGSDAGTCRAPGCAPVADAGAPVRVDAGAMLRTDAGGHSTPTDAGAPARVDAGSCARERCDGVQDEDCDTRVDEGCDCVDGASRACGEVNACTPGRQQCHAGRWGECVGWLDASAEICNARDDDCDGRIDENLSRACGGPHECAQACEQGEWRACRRRDGEMCGDADREDHDRREDRSDSDDDDRRNRDDDSRRDREDRQDDDRDDDDRD